MTEASLSWQAKAALASQPGRFEAKIVRIPESGCWIWMGACTDGYGHTSRSGKQIYAHRLSYELASGPIPAGLDIDHLCRVRSCVNPNHLEAVTRQENIRRGIVGDVHRARYALITHCPAGHPYDKSNTYFNSGSNCRSCRACSRARSAKKRAR